MNTFLGAHYEGTNHRILFYRRRVRYIIIYGWANCKERLRLPPLNTNRTQMTHILVGKNGIELPDKPIKA